jgi:hypothetical protein
MKDWSCFQSLKRERLSCYIRVLASKIGWSYDFQSLKRERLSCHGDHGIIGPINYGFQSLRRETARLPPLLRNRSPTRECKQGRCERLVVHSLFYHISSGIKTI